MHNEVGFLITSCGLQMPSCLEFLLCFLPVCNQTDGLEMNPVVPSAEETTEGSFLLSLRHARQLEVWMSRSRNCGWREETAVPFWYELPLGPAHHPSNAFAVCTDLHRWPGIKVPGGQGLCFTHFYISVLSTRLKSCLKK